MYPIQPAGAYLALVLAAMALIAMARTRFALAGDGLPRRGTVPVQRKAPDLVLAMVGRAADEPDVTAPAVPPAVAEYATAALAEYAAALHDMGYQLGRLQGFVRLANAALDRRDFAEVARIIREASR